MNSARISGGTITITTHAGESMAFTGCIEIPSSQINRNDVPPSPVDLSSGVTISVTFDAGSWRIYDTLSRRPRAPRKVAQWKRERSPIRYQLREKR